MTTSPYHVLSDDANPIGFEAFLRLERLKTRPENPEIREIRIQAKPEEPPRCPICGGIMVYNGTAKRTVKEGSCEYSFRVQIVLCPHCRKVRRDKTTKENPQYTHRILPEGLFPYRRTPTEVLFACGELGEEERRRPPDQEALEKARARWNLANRSGYETRTQSRWKQWFTDLKERLAAVLRALGCRLQLEEYRKAADALAKTHAGSGLPEKAVRMLLKKLGNLSIHPA